MKKFFLLVPLLFFSLFFNMVNPALAANGSTGDCGVVVNLDSSTYSKSGTISFYAKKPANECGKNLSYIVIIEKNVNGKWEYQKQVNGLKGVFTQQTPTKSIKVSNNFSSTGTYRLRIWLSDGIVAQYGNAYSHSFKIQ
ncbi:hypothetical protein [Bacillus cereus]|uniref:hypothetical protein n=1 Tax=Bacillus cereus TaxID=1396 RepID=UPI000BFB2406|nr:hypothetical protein [Bacillus cereus]PGU52783.1 hypothetical protein COD72_20480 [Bacillus cereus]